MTKKHYIALAAALKIERDALIRGTFPEKVTGFDVAVDAMCRTLKQANPAFDWARFMAAVIG